MAGKNFTLDSDDIDLLDSLKAIRRALHIGMASFGEIERIDDAYDTLKACGIKVPQGLKPIHPTAAPDTIGIFAEALRLLDNMEPELRATTKVEVAHG